MNETIPSAVWHCEARRRVHHVGHQFPHQMTMACDEIPPKVVLWHPFPAVGFLTKETLPESPDVIKRVSTIPRGVSSVTHDYVPTS